MDPPSRIITLTTDFGQRDSYVAQMKGVILGISPGATLVDVSHDVGPQAIEEALYITQTAWEAFAAGTVHVCVVDPGVGTDRPALALETERGWFVGPDNGALSSALPDAARDLIVTPETDSRGQGNARPPALAAVPEGVKAFEITNERYMREHVSATFHGRDVFAPAAAHLSLGVSASDLGPAIDELFAYPPLRARRDEDGVLRARVIHVDGFGNVITDARAEDLPPAFTATLRGRRRINGPTTTYAEASPEAGQSRPRLAAIVGSGGYLELALPNGRAAAELAARLGDEVEIRPEE